MYTANEHSLTPRTKALWQACEKQRQENRIVPYKETHPIQYRNIIKLSRRQFLQGLAKHGR